MRESAITRGNIATYSWREREPPRETKGIVLYLLFEKKKRKKETIDPLDRVHRFTRSIGISLYVSVFVNARFFMNTLIIVTLIFFNL